MRHVDVVDRQRIEIVPADTPKKLWKSGFDLIGFTRAKRQHVRDKIAVPYMRNANDWYEDDGFQIISAGLDGEFGTGDPAIIRSVDLGTGFVPTDEDNITNYCSAATIGGDMQ